MTETTIPTWTGVVQGIYTTTETGAPTKPNDAVRAVAGIGLEGDRYALGDDHAPSRQVTLIESEALEAARRDYDVTLGDGESRRNIVTAGVPLNHLVGREFSVGEVRMRGVELCEPCGYLQDLSTRQVVKALRHRGGLNAEILSTGTIRTGDPITPAER